MLVRKKFLSAVIVALPVFAPLAIAGVGSDGDQGAAAEVSQLDELRAQCEEYSSNEQMKEFKMRIECSGSYSFWVRQDATYSLETGSTMSMQTMTKDDKYRTQATTLEFPGQPVEGQCSIWTKKTMRSPGVGLPVTLNSCDQLTHEFVERRCQQELQDYCEENSVNADQVQSSSSSSAVGGSSSSAGELEVTAGMCVLSTEGQPINTCGQ